MAAVSGPTEDDRIRRRSTATEEESETRKSDSHLKDSFFFSYEVLHLPSLYTAYPQYPTLLTNPC